MINIKLIMQSQSYTRESIRWFFLKNPTSVQTLCNWVVNAKAWERQNAILTASHLLKPFSELAVKFVLHLFEKKQHDLAVLFLQNYIPLVKTQNRVEVLEALSSYAPNSFTPTQQLTLLYHFIKAQVPMFISLSFNQYSVETWDAWISAASEESVLERVLYMSNLVLKDAKVENLEKLAKILNSTFLTRQKSLFAPLSKNSTRSTEKQILADLIATAIKHDIIIADAMLWR